MDNRRRVSARRQSSILSPGDMPEQEAKRRRLTIDVRDLPNQNKPAGVDLRKVQAIVRGEEFGGERPTLYTDIVAQ